MISSTLMIFLIPDIATVFFGTYTYPFLLLTKSLWLKSSKGLASSMHNLSPYFNLALRCLFFFLVHNLVLYSCSGSKWLFSDLSRHSLVPWQLFSDTSLDTSLANFLQIVFEIFLLLPDLSCTVWLSLNFPTTHFSSWQLENAVIHFVSPVLWESTILFPQV